MLFDHFEGIIGRSGRRRKDMRFIRPRAACDTAYKLFISQKLYKLY